MKEQGQEKSFKDFDLSESIQEAVAKCGFTKPTPIQSEVIPHILAGVDVVAQAQTGTGKTAAFGLPALELILGKPPKEGMLVITPTRELAVQVSEELAKYGRSSGIKTVAVYGGDSAQRQIDAIQRGANVIVATPGRLLDLLESKRLKNFEPSIVVLDEADEMLNMGFLEDVQAIFQYLPKERQTLLFSATLSDPIQRLIRKILKDPMFITVGSTGFSHQDIEHIFYDLKDHKRENAFFRLLLANNPSKAIVFCRTKKDVDDLTVILTKMGFPVRCLHGDIQQSTRQQVTNSFKKGDIKFLIATDVAARGLDISDVSHIFNYQIPFGPDEYVHRAGRTGRAGNKGIAITLGTSHELRKLGRMLGPRTNEITIQPIPSAKQMYNIQVETFTNSIAKQQIREGVNDVVAKLQEKVDSEELVALLLSYLIDKEKLVQQEEDKFESSSSSRGPRREGGYGDRPPRREGGYGDRGPRREGGYGDRGPRKEGSFNPGPRREGGFGDRGPRKEGSFNPGPRKEGSFNPGPKKEGFGDKARRPAFGGNRSVKPRPQYNADASKAPAYSK